MVASDDRFPIQCFPFTILNLSSKAGKLELCTCINGRLSTRNEAALFGFPNHQQDCMTSVELHGVQNRSTGRASFPGFPSDRFYACQTSAAMPVRSSPDMCITDAYRWGWPACCVQTSHAASMCFFSSVNYSWHHKYYMFSISTCKPFSARGSELTRFCDQAQIILRRTRLVCKNTCLLYCEPRAGRHGRKISTRTAKRFVLTLPNPKLNCYFCQFVVNLDSSLSTKTRD